MPLDRRAERLLAMLAATGTEPGAAATPDERRQALVALARMADDLSAPIGSFEDRNIAGPDGPIGLRIYSPAGAETDPLPGLVFFHGGGWVAGGLETHDGLCRRLCEAAGVRLVAVDYRLAPEHRFPAGLEDCLAATRWVAAHAAELGIDAQRLAVGGDSAGGGLAAAVARIARDGGGPKIALQVLICPILDVGAASGSRAAFADGYFISRSAFARDLEDYLTAGGIDLADPRLSPLGAPSFAGLPPAIIHTAQFDPFRDEGEAYAAALGRAGVPTRIARHAGMIHYFYALARAIPYATAAAAMIGAQVRERLSAEPISHIVHGRA